MPQGPEDLGALTIDASDPTAVTFSCSRGTQGATGFSMHFRPGPDFPISTDPVSFTFATVGSTARFTIPFSTPGSPPWAAGHENQAVGRLPPGVWSFLVYAYDEGGSLVGMSQQANLTIACPSPFPWPELYMVAGVWHVTRNFEAWFNVNPGFAWPFATKFPDRVLVD
jgi:hypothetical protein